MTYANILNIAEAETVATKRGLHAWAARYLRYASEGKKLPAARQSWLSWLVVPAARGRGRSSAN
jgi:hypothetical protein